MRVGIDFGTTRTVVAGVDDGRHPVAAFDLDAGYRTWLPSGVAVAEGGALVFGDEGQELLRAGRPGLRSIKRAAAGLALDDLVELEGAAPITALELTTRFLTWVRETLVRHGNLGLREGEAIEAMVAVPANASSRARFSTLEAFRAAGFEVLGMLNEPTAGAIEFAHRNRNVLSPRSPKRYVVVYDLGGGTFDAAAVSLEGARFTLLASEGIARLGGEDFDVELLALAREAWGGEIEAGLRGGLLERCREAKESMGPRARKLMVDPSPLLDAAPAVLEVSALDERCAPLIERTVATLDALFAGLRVHGIDPDEARELGAIYLVGGGVSFPAVLRALRARYDRKVQLAPEPHAATAVGLAVAADEAAGVHVREASTRTLGVWREKERGRDALFDPILDKGAMPGESERIVVRRRYRPAHTVGYLRFVECSRVDASGRPDGDVTPSREVYFPYDARLAERHDLGQIAIDRTEGLGDEILETYTYERDGRMRVAIENVTRAYRREFELGSR